MDGSTEPTTPRWRIDLNAPPRLLTAEAQAALTRASKESAFLRRQPSGEGGWERVASAARSAVLLGADEHELAVATGLTLEAVRSLLRPA